MGNQLTTRTRALKFHSTPLHIIRRDGEVWLRLPQIEGALGYSNKGRGLSTLYERNAAEFTDRMTQLVTLPTAGGPQEVRLFSLRGAHLLAMFARTERAAEFRRWVLDVLDQHAGGPAPAAAPALPAPAPAPAPTGPSPKGRRWLLSGGDGIAATVVELPDDVLVITPAELALQANQSRIDELRRIVAEHERQAKDHRDTQYIYKDFTKTGNRTKWLSHQGLAAVFDWKAEQVRDQLRELGCEPQTAVMAVAVARIEYADHGRP